MVQSILSTELESSSARVSPRRIHDSPADSNSSSNPQPRFIQCNPPDLIENVGLSRAWNESHIGTYFFNSVIVVCGGVVQNLGLMNSYLGLILVYAAHGMSFSVFFLTAFFRTQSKELAEAALVDGCTHWGVLFRIMLPLARPGLVSIGIFQFLGMWNEYLLPLVLNTDEKRYLVTQGLANIAVTQGYHSDFSGLFAGLTISIIPVLAVYLGFHRQISAGMTAGALK